MAKFPITRAREELGFVPTTAVRADIDVRTGEGAVGTAIGQAIVLGGKMLLEIRKRRQQMTDAVSSVTADKLRQVADAEFDTFKLTNPQETWEDFRKKQAETISQKIAGLQFSNEAQIIQQAKSATYSEVSVARAITDATLQLRTDTIGALTENMVEAFRTGDPKKILDSTKTFTANGSNMGKDKAEVLSDIKAAKEAGAKLRSQDAISLVHAALEASSDPITGGDFTNARELAKNPIIPEPQQTTLRNAIRSAETAMQTQTDKQLKQLQEVTAIKYSGLVSDVKTSTGAVTLMNDIDNDIAIGALDRKVGEGYKRELVKGREVPTNWKTYNQLVLDIEAVRDGDKDFLEVFNDIQTHRGGDLNGSEIDALTASVRTAKSIAQGDLPSVTANSLTRFQRILTAYYNAGMWGDISDEDEMPEAAAKYADKAAQLDKFFAEEKPTFKESEEFFKQLTKDAEKEGFFGKLWKRLGTIEPTTLGFQIASDIHKNKLKELGNQERLKLDSRNIGDLEIINGENWVLIKRGKTPAEDIWQKQ